MKHRATSLRPFIGALDFELSRDFYRIWGFEETVLEPNLSVFKTEGLAFYLQNAYVKDWVDNSMVFLEVDNLDRYWNDLVALDLQGKYSGAKITPIRNQPWGRVCYVHDPSGILWHIGEFSM